MNRAARMLLLSSGRKDNNNDGERRGGMGVDMRKNRDGYRDGNYRSPENMYGGAGDVRRYDDGRYDGGYYGGAYLDEWDRPEPENAFRDRRGRRHYDNGRYAPMDMVGNYPYTPSPMRRYPIKADPGMRMWPNEMPYDDPERDPYRGTYMGFMHHKGYDFEGEGRIGNMEGYAKGRVLPSEEHKRHKKEIEPLDEETAKEWVDSMENVDGTKGQHYSMEQAKQLMKQHNIECNEIDFYTALNMMYSDTKEVAKKFGMDKPEFYVCMAKSWLSDPDISGGGAEKLARYYKYVVCDE